MSYAALVTVKIPPEVAGASVPYSTWAGTAFLCCILAAIAAYVLTRWCHDWSRRARVILSALIAISPLLLLPSLVVLAMEGALLLDRLQLFSRPLMLASLIMPIVCVPIAIIPTRSSKSPGFPDIFE
jgi:cytochrome bd-type quinol oxidase subunit 2